MADMKHRFLAGALLLSSGLAGLAPTTMAGQTGASKGAPQTTQSSQTADSGKYRVDTTMVDPMTGEEMVIHSQTMDKAAAQKLADLETQIKNRGDDGQRLYPIEKVTVEKGAYSAPPVTGGARGWGGEDGPYANMVEYNNMRHDLQEQLDRAAQKNKPTSQMQVETGSPAGGKTSTVNAAPDDAWAAKQKQAQADYTNMLRSKTAAPNPSASH